MVNRLIVMGLLSFIFGCTDKPNKKTIEVDKQSINVISTEGEENYKYDLIDLTAEQRDFINQNVSHSKKVISKYLGDGSGGTVDSKALDKVLAKWSTSTGNKESAKELVDAIGAAFGQEIVDELDFEWKVITDQYGTDITVIHKKYVVNGFPFSSVQKAVTEENPRSLDDIRLMLKSQVETAARTGEIDLRK
jgi:hypothetical protein